mgnify:CR=1 FL=1
MQYKSDVKPMILVGEKHCLNTVAESIPYNRN